MHLDGFNLNLLVALDTLLECPTMTEAAQRLSLTQPAMSGALKKLREHYHDPLIIYAAGGSHHTALARQLRPLIRQMLTTARDTVKLSIDFDPTVDTARFCIAATDWIELVLLNDMLGKIASEAPNVAINVHPISPCPAEEILREGSDLVLTTRQFVSEGYSFEPLFTDRFACIAWRDNPQITTTLDRETFERLSHAGATGSADRDLSAPPGFLAMNRSRHIRVKTSVHATLPHIVVGTELLAVTSWRFALRMARTLPIVVFPVPFDIPDLQICAQWQPYRDNDPAMRWLLGSLRQQVAGLPPLSAGLIDT